MRGLTEPPQAEVALDRRLDPESDAPIALALSGGGDSMALLHITQAWARRHGRRVLAFTVDHGLQPSSAAWTAFAGETARAAGAEWLALSWEGPKPSVGLPAAARMARHRLLADATREAGASVILFAHTRDDIAEADVMRAEAAPTLGHLREWSPSPVWPEGRGMFVLRPLLGIRRAALRERLQADGRSWLEDPANDDPRFVRARARNFLASRPVQIDPPLKPGSDNDLAALARAAHHTVDGRIEIACADLMRATPSTTRRFLSIAVVCAAGASSPPRGARLERLADTVRRGDALVATLTGARISSDGTMVSFAREAGDLVRQRVADLDLSIGGRAVWDGRFEIATDEPVRLGALSGRAARLSRLDRARVNAFPVSARLSLPVVLQGVEARLPRPFGEGPANVRALTNARFAGSCGLIAHERDISRPTTALGMAQARRSSYVEALALA